jgi:hypothetical protein
MVPFVPFQRGKASSKKPEDRTAVTVLDADGKRIGPLTREPVAAQTIIIDRGGFGVRGELPAERHVHRGEASTVMIHLTTEPAPASKIALRYRIVPFGGEK